MRLFDRVLVLGLLGLGAMIVLLGGFTHPLLVILVGTAQVVPLWWRRTHPGSVMAAVAVASAAQVPLVDHPLASQLAFPVAVYSAARWAAWPSKAVAQGTTLVVTLCAAVVAAWSWTHPWWSGPSDMVTPFLATAGIAVTAWALGLAGSQRDGLLRSLVARAEEAERVAERDVALAAQDERARIAREMHDVVAHGLSVIVVQADGARYAAAKDPDVAVTTLGTIAETGRSSLAEMRRLLGLLRTGDSGVRPQPRLDDVPHLVDEARAGGMAVEADWPDPRAWPAVPEGVGLAVYRLVQEALTNVRKHAGSDPRVSVRLAFSTVPDRVIDVEVVDDGRGASADGGRGQGLGLVGMQERLAVHSGTVDAGPAPGGGWRVAARIPL